MSFSPRTKELADSIGTACTDLLTHPADLTYGSFLRWLREEKRLSQKDLQEIRLHLQRIGGFSKLRDAFYGSRPSDITVERVEMHALAKFNKNDRAKQAFDSLFLNRLSQVMVRGWAELAKRPIVATKYHASHKPIKRVVTLMLSDLHLGSKLDTRELPYRYDYEEEARALASIIVRTNNYKRDYRNESELVIWFGGDIITGKIHDPESSQPAAEQFCDAVYLLTQVIQICASEWRRVTVYCSTGNHDRNAFRHHGKAMEQRWDSEATKIYFAIKMAVANIKNVQVNIPRTAYAEWEVCGHAIYMTHGDNNLNVGNPAKVVSIDNINKQMNALALARQKKGLKPYAVFGVGHVHQGMSLPMPSGHLIINPAMMPVGGYAESVAYPISWPGQTMFETTKEHPVGDLRFLNVTLDHMSDRSLDKIIVPFRDF